MDDLFTFNSHQFQAIRLPKPSIKRRVIIKRSESKQSPSPNTSPSTNSQSHNSHTILRSQFKKVSFTQIPSPTLSHQSPQVDRPATCDDISSWQSGNCSVSSHRYESALRKLPSVEEQLQEEAQKEAKTENGQTGQEEIRRERRFKSLKLAPRVVFPLSDRKLPNVFKIGSSNLQLPPISIKRKEPNRKQTLSTKRISSEGMQKQQGGRQRSGTMWTGQRAQTPRG